MAVMKHATILTLCALAFASSAPAAVLLSNLGQTVGVATAVSSLPATKATDFITDGTGGTLTSIKFQGSTGGLGTGTINVRVYQDSSGTLGSLVTNGIASGAVSGAAVNDYTFDFASTGATLAANTKYWLEFSTTDAFFSLQRNTSQSADSGYAFNTVTATKDRILTGMGWLSDIDSQGIRFELYDTSAVPEPSRTVLLMAGMLGLVVRRKRK